MKTKKAILSVLAIFATILVSAQTDYHFNQCTLVAGTEKQQGAVYRFSSVQPEVDALITVDKLTRSATLDSFDISGPGFAASLQPAYSIEPHCWGYVQFNIQFVKAGTSIPVAIDNIPAKGKIYSDHKEVKLDVLNTSASSFKVRMYSSNQHAYALNTKADLLLQKLSNENKTVSETAVAKLNSDTKGK